MINTTQCYCREIINIHFYTLVSTSFSFLISNKYILSQLHVYFGQSIMMFLPKFYICCSVISAFDCVEMFLQPTLSLDKDSLSQERPTRTSRQPKRKQRVPVEPELSESDDYVDFPDSRQQSLCEFRTVVVGEETETSSAVQSIQQVGPQDVLFSKDHNKYYL